MKRFTLFATLASILVLALWPTDRFTESTTPESHRGSVYESEASEGTKENPRARLEYEWLQLRNPATGTIPRDIARLELAFAKRLAADSRLRSITAAESWVSRGPYNVGGRSKALAIDVTNESIILAGSVSSGIYRSTDGGSSWTKRTAPNQLHSVTSVAQNKAAGKEHIWYYSTGDRSPESIVNSAIGLLGSDSFFRGDGIFKSVDGGDTWTQLPSTVSGTADRTDAFDFVWGIATFGEDGVLAATGWGVYTSTDGGATWARSLGTSEGQTNSPNTEVAVSSDGTMYATVAGNGPDHGVYRSFDGETWQNISPTDWASRTTRTVIGPAPSNPNVVYFFTETAPFRQELRKYEAGVGWTNLTSGLPFGAQILTFGGYLLMVYVKPDDQNTLFLGTVDLVRSTDGGASFETISGQSGATFHQDQVAIAFYPSNPSRMIVGNDGGLYRTDDNLAATNNLSLDWKSLNNGYLTSQFYTVAVDHGTPGSEALIGGTQDNGIVYTNSSDPEEPWQFLFGGDGGQVAIADGGEHLYSAHAATFRLYRHSFPGGGIQQTQITPTGVGLGLWRTIFQLDEHDQRMMYLPSQSTIWRNSNLTAIPFVQGGGPTDINWESLDNVKDHYIHSLGMSKASPRRLYYSASDNSADADERMFYLDNPHEGQPVPVDITGENFPFYPYVPFINCIAVDPRDVNKVTIVFPSHGELSIFHTENAGGTWTPVSGNLEENPDGSGGGPSVRWVEIFYLKDNTPVYLAGTSVGLFSTTALDGMNTEWAPEATTSIGNVVIGMLDVRESDGFVAVSTHGNGVYTTYITELTTANEADGVTPEGFFLSSAYPNPFNVSTTVQYELPSPGVVTAAIYDIRGRRIETLFEGMRQAGQQQIRWTPGDAADGVYFVRVDFGDGSKVERVVLQR